MSEHDLQVAVAQYLDLMGWLWCAVPNGGNRNVITGAKLKAEGVKRGVPDILIFEDWHKYLPYAIFKGHGIAIELKFGKGRVSKEQKEWLENLKKRNWKTAVCRSIDEVIEVTDCLKR
jgi:hypothetical protein